MKHMRTIRLLPIALCLGLFTLVGCKTQLAPEYDKAIVAGLTDATQNTMYFLATLEEGTTANTFSERLKYYNQLIGAFDALAIQAKARPVPDNVATKKINELLQAKGSDPLSSEYPSAFAFGKISETFKKMKETDQKNGIKPFALLAFKGQILIFLDQAITYESFLKR